MYCSTFDWRNLIDPEEFSFLILNLFVKTNLGVNSGQIWGRGVTTVTETGKATV